MISTPETPTSVLLQQLRWMSVLCQAFLLLTMFEPARNAWLYNSSWAYRVAAVSTLTRGPFICWFVLAIGLALPLLVGLLLAPRSRFTRDAVAPNAIGTFLAAVGHGYIATTIVRWDAPGQAVASFWANCLMLVFGALVMACWKNARHVQTFNDRQKKAERVAAGVPCDASRT